MQIVRSDGSQLEASPSALEAAVRSLSDPADFLVLRDPNFGEIRASGPNEDTFFLQCTLTFAQPQFRGEAADLTTAETIDVLTRFARRDISLLERFSSKKLSITGVSRAVFFLVVAAIIAVFLWIITTVV
jgi:hypothetical protein